LAGVQFFSSTSDINIEGWRPDQADETITEKLITSERRNKQIYDAVMDGLRETAGKTMVRGVKGNGQMHAKMVANMLDGKPHPVTGRPLVARAIGTSIEGSAKTLEQFRSTREIDILTTVQMGLLGTDIPDLNSMVHASPTPYYSELLQAFGRGTRLKDDGSIFRFHQIEDMSHADMALIYRALGFNQRPPQGFLLSPQHEASEATEKEPVNQGDPENQRQSWDSEQLVPDASMAVKIGEVSLTAAAGADRISLAAISKQTGLTPKNVQDILAKMGYDYVADPSGDPREQKYDEIAVEELKAATALPGALDMKAACHVLDIKRTTFETLVEELGIELPLLYKPSDSHAPGLIKHALPDHIAAMQKRIKETMAPLDPETEISQRDVCALTGRSAGDIFTYLGIRHFSSTKRSPQGTRYTITIYNRRQIMEWWHKYSNAQPIDEVAEATPLEKIRNYTISDLTLAARKLGIPIEYGTIKGRRVDYVPRIVVEALTENAKQHKIFLNQTVPLANIAQGCDLSPKMLSAYLTSSDRSPLARSPDSPITNQQRRHVAESMRQFVAIYDHERQDNAQFAKQAVDIVDHEPLVHQAIVQAVRQAAKPPIHEIPADAVERQVLEAATSSPALLAKEQQAPSGSAMARKPKDDPDVDTRAQIFGREKAEKLATFTLDMARKQTFRFRALNYQANLVPLRSVSLNTKQSIAILLGFIKSMPSLSDAVYGRYQNELMCDRTTSARLGMLLSELRQIDPEWLSLQSIVSQLGITHDSAIEWLRQNPVQKSELREFKCQDDLVHFLAPTLVARMAIDFYSASRTVLKPAQK
jgi:hypothetical protein